MTTKLPNFPVPFNTKWKYLSGLCLADPDLGIPDHVDILLGANVFSRVVRQGQRIGPPGSPLTLNTGSVWAPSRMVKPKHPKQGYINKRTATHVALGSVLKSRLAFG